jgi:hypothetical protein
VSQSTLIVGALLLGFVLYTMIVGTWPKYLGFVTGGGSAAAAPASGPPGSGTNPGTIGQAIGNGLNNVLKGIGLGPIF